MPASARKTLTVDFVSDVVCPWCYIGKRRLENAIALVDDVDVTVNCRPFFLNPWVPREGISREDYLTQKFGSVERYNGMASRVAEAAAAEGLLYDPGKVRRQPNTTDSHRLIHWADAIGKADAMEQRLMETLPPETNTEFQPHSGRSPISRPGISLSRSLPSGTARKFPLRSERMSCAHRCREHQWSCAASGRESHT
jgi:hypothetical protein